MSVVVPDLRQPTFRSVWPGDDELAREALEFADALGLVPDPWQAQVLSDWMLVDPETYRWTHRSAALIVPRQNGKTWACSVRLLAALFLRPGGEVNILYSAHRFSSATAQFRELVRLIDGNDDLRKRVKRLRSSTGNEMIETVAGALLVVQSRTNTMTSQTRGRSFDLVFLDEALVLQQAYMDAMLPTLSSRPNPQVIYASSGGDHDSEVLAKVRRAGYDGTPGLTLSEYAAGPDDDLDAEETVARTNPGYPLRPTPEAVAQERATLTRTALARERFGVWSTGAPEPALAPEAFSRVVDGDIGFPPYGVALMGFDVSVRDGQRFGALSVVWRDAGGEFRGLLVASGDLTDGWYWGKVAEVSQRFGISKIVMVPGQAVDVADGMPSGVEVVRKTFGFLQASSQRFVELVAASPRVLRVQRSQVLDDTVKVSGKAISSTGGWHFSSKYIPAAPVLSLAVALTALESGEFEEEAAIW